MKINYEIIMKLLWKSINVSKYTEERIWDKIRHMKNDKCLK